MKKRPSRVSPDEQRLKFTIAYHGAKFRGWQKGNGRTVQDALIEALERSLPDASGIRVDGAGRTDAGVHAEGQVASVVVPRTYRFTIVDGPCGDPFLNDRAWRYTGDLDVRAMEMVAPVLIGEHDFAAFTADKKKANTVRTVLSIDIGRRAPSTQQPRHPPGDSP